MGKHNPIQACTSGYESELEVWDERVEVRIIVEQTERTRVMRCKSGMVCRTNYWAFIRGSYVRSLQPQIV